jgi:hypothetical protein
MITSLPASTTYTPKQALLSALEFIDGVGLTDVLIVGYDGDGDLVIRSSRMDRKDALWMAEMLKAWALK